MVAKSAVNDSLYSAPASPDKSRAEQWLQEQLKRAVRLGKFTVSAELTPELAELLLANNAANRHQSSNKVASYARDIKVGNWQHNGEPVIVAHTGDLNDGQHRCLAVIEAGRSITTEIGFGFHRDTRSTIDTGMKRTVGQHLQMRGIKNANHQANAARCVIVIQRTKRLSPSPDAQPTQTEIIEWVEGHQAIHDHLLGVSAVARRFKFSLGVLASLQFLMAAKSPSDADSFFALLGGKAGLSESDKTAAIILLQDKLEINKDSKRKYPAETIAAMVIKTWNYYRKGRSIKKLEWKSEEKFPMPE